MVSARVSGSSGLGSIPGRGHCVVFLGKTLDTGELNAGGNLAMDQHPVQGREKLPLVASCYRNRYKLRPDGPLGLYVDLTFMDLSWIPLIALFAVNFAYLHYNKIQHVCEAIWGYFVVLYRNCLASTLDYIVLQMRKTNLERGYSNSVISNSPLFKTQNHFPRICPSVIYYRQFNLPFFRFP